MKGIFLLVAVFFLGIIPVFSQKSYIQVSGEPNLSVYLDGTFKGTTTLEYKGYIIDNVSAGTHTIKVVKSGYIPFEESITVKAGEVFAYQVKPFSRNGVTISEQGNTASSEKKVELPKGTLVIQSVPIDIKITMPQIEGLKDVAKTKDKWTVNNITEGKFLIQFSFGAKTISKNIDIMGGFTTSAFINMMSGEFTVVDPLSQKKEKDKTIEYFNSLLRSYNFKRGLTPSQFFANNTEASALAGYSDGKGWYFLPDKLILKNKIGAKGSRSLGANKNYVGAYAYCITSFADEARALQEMRDLGAKIQRETNKDYVSVTEMSNYFEFTIDELNMRLRLDVTKVGKNRYEVDIYFYDDKYL